MLDEKFQNRLAKIIPLGTNVTKRQVKIRENIRHQKRQLEELNALTFPTTNSRVNTYDISYWNDLISSNLNEWGINRYGVSPILRQYSFKNADVHPEETRAIVVAIAMDYHQMQSAPSIEAATAILDAYWRTGSVVIKLVKLLQKHRIQVTGHHPLGNKDEYHHLLFPPHAVEAGLGEKGRTGLFIDHKLGPLVRLGMVTTTLPIPFGKPIDKGIFAFCHRCRYCVKYCPPKAITSDKYLESLRLNQTIQFKINSKNCMRYFMKHNGCGKCLVKCVLAQSTEKDITKRVKRIEHWYHTWVLSGELDKLHKDVLA